MNASETKGTRKRSKLLPFAIGLIIIGVLAVSVPLVLQQINYHQAAQEVAKLQQEIKIPSESDYIEVDYSLMKMGETPVYSSEEMKEAGNPPGVLDQFGLGSHAGNLALMLFPGAKAEESVPDTMREAIERGAEILEKANAEKNPSTVKEVLEGARRQLEYAFFYLTAVQPLEDSEQIAVIDQQIESDALTRGDKIISAAHTYLFNMFTALEGMLSQVEDMEAQVAAMDKNSDEYQIAHNLLLYRADVMALYYANVALHLPTDDYRGGMAQHLALAQEELGAVDIPDTREDLTTEDSKGRSYLLNIPGISVEVAVFRSSTFNSMYRNMHKGAAMFPRAPEPDVIGNICISSHRTGTRDYFRYLNELSPGDKIYLHTSHLGSFEYEVEYVKVIEKDDWAVTSATDYPALTLLSCEEYQGISNGKRIMVRAKLVRVAPLEAEAETEAPTE